jgi:hypothetical protein
MRYNPKCVKFWQIGYRLFHGKFLRFMSGLKHLGHVVGGVSEKGDFNPAESSINFAVLSRQSLYHNAGPSKPFFPGINEEAITAIANHFGSKPLKLAFDGKKISRGKGKKCEILIVRDTKAHLLLARREVHENNLKFEEESAQMIDSYEESGISYLYLLEQRESGLLLSRLHAIVEILAKENKGLREKGTHLRQTEDKFMKLGGTNWSKSKFYPVICSLRVGRAEVRELSES